MQQVRSLDKKWKEFLYAFSGFGPNFLMVLLGAYFTDAINPSALVNAGVYQRFASGACYILPALFPILYAISKAFDGIIDIPFAHLSDTLSTKWGRRRPAIAVSLPIMLVSYAMCWIPVGGIENQTLNTVWIIIWSLLFFSTYTLGMIAFYGSLSTVCTDEPQRLRVSGYKSFFDTISYCFVYALVPLILSGMQVHINVFVYACVPLMLTLLIPLFMIKEGEKYGYPENAGMSDEKITLVESFRLTFKNRIFMRWQAVNCCTYFGLQMFLVSMNTLISGGMGMTGAEMALLNTCAFGPVPVMLYLFNKLKKKKGIRFTYQTCLVAFAVAIMSFFFGSKFILGDNNKLLQYIIGCSGSVIGSWAIGAFFMMPYLVPSQVSSVEEKLTGRNHSAMYFAANAVCTSIVSAISGSLIYETIKNLFISKGASGVIWATGQVVDGTVISAVDSAAAQFGVETAQVFNLGTLLVPFIVAACCILGAILAQKMPKDYTPERVARQLKELDPSLDISAIEQDPSYHAKEEKGEIIFVQIGLSVLSGFIFGFIWMAYLFKSVKEFIGSFKNRLAWVLCAFVPFASLYYVLKLRRELAAQAEEAGVKFVGSKFVFILLGVLFPVLPVNVIGLALMQKNLNNLYANQAD